MPWRVSDPSPRSPVITAVTARSFKNSNRRASSDRRMDVLENAPNSVSIVSITTRFAPTASIAAPRRKSRPSRSQSPVSCMSPRTKVTWSSIRSPSVSSWARSKPSEATFDRRSSMLSSNAKNTPGSLNSVIPRTRNSIAINVFPQPAGPHTSVERPFGRPPPVTSSRPLIPVGVFRRPASFGAGSPTGTSTPSSMSRVAVDTCTRFRCHTKPRGLDGQHCSSRDEQCLLRSLS